MGYTHGRLVCIGCQSFQLVSEGRLVIFSRQRRPDRTVSEEPFVYAPSSGRQMPLTLGYPTQIYSVSQLKSTNVCSVCNREGNASGRLIGEELFPSPIVYHCLCSLNRCYLFFVLWCLSLQTSGFPL